MTPQSVMAVVSLVASDDALITGRQLAILLGVIIITSLMLISARRKIRESRNTPRAYSRDLYARLKEEKTAIGNMQEVMLELEQLARQIHGQIDTRYAKLEAVIRDADQRIETLSRLTRTQDDAPVLDVTVGIEQNEEHDPATDNAALPHADVHRLADAGLGVVQIAKETDRNVGEVELILALRKTRTRTDPLPAQPESDSPAAPSVR